MGVSEKFESTGMTKQQGFDADDRHREEAPTQAARYRVAIELIRNHEGQLRASARRVSICADDAEDAVQRGIEILLSKAPTADVRRLLPWARTVVRNEALAIRRSRERILARPAPIQTDGGDEGRDWVAELPCEGEGPSELVVRREAVDRGREALAALKPQELKALTQLAHGYSYEEIGAINGWTRTKVNRCLAEGRARLRSVVRESEAGERCGQVSTLVSACADGELDGDDLVVVRNHLAVCGSCRATLREYRSIPFRVAALVPAGPIAADSVSGGPIARLAEWADGFMVSVWTRATALMPGQEAGLGATLASGGLRGAGAAGLAKLAAICMGTAGGAAACVAAGILPMPLEQRAGQPAGQPTVKAVERPVEVIPAESVVRPDPETGQGPLESTSSQPPQSGSQSEPPGPEPSEPVAAEFSPEANAVPVTSSAATPSPAPVAPQAPTPKPSPAPVSGEFQP